MEKSESDAFNLGGFGVKRKKPFSCAFGVWIGKSESFVYKGTILVVADDLEEERDRLRPCVRDLLRDRLLISFTIACIAGIAPTIP